MMSNDCLIQDSLEYLNILYKTFSNRLSNILYCTCDTKVFSLKIESFILMELMSLWGVDGGGACYFWGYVYIYANGVKMVHLIYKVMFITSENECIW